MRAATLLAVIAPATLLTVSPALARDTKVANQAEFAAAVKSAKPGDTIILANGEWRDAQLIFTGTGAADKPITVTAETRGRVVLSGQSNLRMGGRYLVVSGLVFKNGHSPTKEVISFRRDSKTLASDSRVTEVVIDGYSNPDRRAEDIWVALYGTNNRVDHSHFEGKTNSGVTLAVIRRTGDPLDNRHRIDHNYFGPRPPLGSNGGETVRIGTSEESLSASNTTVERNIFDRTSGEVEIVSVKAGGNIIRENLVLQSQGAFVLRHGNGNRVERNIFLGKNVPDTGGVRVINRDQIVRDNYFEGLTGTSFKSALSVMNGVPNSVINRYHQVANAQIERNSIIDSARITLAAGADAERSAAPIDSKVERNLIVGEKGSDPFRAEGEIGGIKMTGNVQARTAKPLLTNGVEQRDVKLQRAANGLLYPTDPALAAIGAPRDLVPVTRGEVGVSWYQAGVPEAAFDSGRTHRLAANASLANAVAASKAGDTLMLAGGNYPVSAPLSVRHRLTIAGAKGAKPVLKLASSLAQIEGGGGLQLRNLVVDASAAPGTTPLIMVGAGAAPNYAISLDTVSIRGPRQGRGDGIAMAAGTFADSITISNSDFTSMGKVVAATGEQEAKGWYPMERLSISGSRFDRVAMVADLLRKGSDESTFGPWFELRDSRIVESGEDGTSLRLSGVQHADITKNSFTNSQKITVIHSVGVPETRIVSNNFIGTAAPHISELVWKGPARGIVEPNMVETRP